MTNKNFIPRHLEQQLMRQLTLSNFAYYVGVTDGQMERIAANKPVLLHWWQKKRLRELKRQIRLIEIRNAMTEGDDIA